RKDGTPMKLGAKPDMHMPYWLSAERYPQLEISATRVERLQQISAKDILAEGVVERSYQCPHLGKCPVSVFDKAVYPDLLSLCAAAWCKITVKSSCEANPGVGVISFKLQ